ncbi:hypothetical protein CAOG_03350 [Capsaspora owczarzaki ATCC 30864]|uniref:Uncharacterized protein n=1 Tax=Capsaspora owczarzaki (strain ATCC 30864) TaxID=595528 RepID=A0A0D2WP53_CAPO3|nr:hypothetical protein CAOG_03350 [Capsaspora owczarzaki ATCC 30864]KJE92368.1 hypothetical protein CAOG_003350 [Capsaspora owczarzaki ATCC 30864]|eukprot:XP_004364189.1 hypothetical protein CAOG_03350 [Capsaspora owczarzaki ATCC 30864]
MAELSTNEMKQLLEERTKGMAEARDRAAQYELNLREKRAKLLEGKTLTTADATSNVKVSDLKQENSELAAKLAGVTGSRALSAEEKLAAAAEQKRRANDPEVQAELRRIDAQIRALGGNPDDDYKPYVVNETVIKEGPKIVKSMFDNIFADLGSFGAPADGDAPAQ